MEVYHRRKALRSRLPLAMLVLGSALSCGRKPGRFVSLPLKLTGTESFSSGEKRREGIWIWPGDHLRWTIPPGPTVFARISYHLPPDWTGGSDQKLVGRAYSAAAPAKAARSETRLSASSRHEPWRDERVAIPGSRTARVLDVSLEGNTADARPLFIAESALDWPRSATPSRRRLIVLFDIDTLRSDHVSLYGYGRPTTPNIDATFRSELVAEHCYANANWTLPSHVCLMTSTNVNRHQVRARDGGIPRNFPLLAESLAAGGYSTIAVTGGGFVDARYGFARGFDRYVSSSDSIEQQVDQALRMIDEAASSSIFLFFHTYQVHDYAPSEASARALLGSTGPLGPQWQLPIADQLHLLGDMGDKRSAALNRYDSALRRVDDAFGAFTGALRKRGIWQDTSIVLTADHGEELFDRPPPRPNSAPPWGHGQPMLYDSELSVPLLVRAPGRLAGGRVTKGLSLLDVAPTILDIAGIAAPSTFEGRSIRASRSAEDRPLFAEAPPYDAVAVHRGVHKAVVRAGFRQKTTDQKYLLDALPTRDCFALDVDPGERNGNRCAEGWASDLLDEEDRYVSENFPDSLVIRLARDAAGPCEVVAHGRTRAPSIRTFAAQPTDRIETGGRISRTPVTVGSGKVWLALRPADSDRGMTIDIVGCGSVRTARGAPVGGDPSREWSEFLWRDPLPLPPGNVLLSVPPMLEPIRASRVGNAPELVARLRALGYLTGGELEPASPGPLPARAPVEDPTVVAPGRISVRVR